MNPNKEFKSWTNHLLNEGNEWEEPMMDFEEKVTERKIRQDKAKKQQEIFLKKYAEKLRKEMEVQESATSKSTDDMEVEETETLMASTSKDIVNPIKKIKKNNNKRKKKTKKLSKNKKMKSK